MLAGFIEPCCAVLLSQPQQRLPFAQVPQSVVRENRLHHCVNIGSQLCRLRPAMRRVKEEKGLGRRWIIILVGLPSSLARRPYVRLDQLFLEVDLDEAEGGSHPYRLSHVARRNRVVAPLEDDMVVRMNLALGRVGERGRRQRLEATAFVALKTGKWGLLSGAIRHSPHLFEAPG